MIKTKGVIFACICCVSLGLSVGAHIGLYAQKNKYETAILQGKIQIQTNIVPKVVITL